MTSWNKDILVKGHFVKKKKIWWHKKTIKEKLNNSSSFNNVFFFICACIHFTQFTNTFISFRTSYLIYLILTTLGLRTTKAKTILNQIRYYLKLWPGQIFEINMKGKMLPGCCMISVCILINITSSLVRQIIPGLSVRLTPRPAAGMLCVSPQPSSFLITPKGGILIEINCIPWNSGSHLPVWALATHPSPWEYQFNPGKTQRWLPGRRNGALESSTEWCDSNAGWGVTLMDFWEFEWTRVCLCLCARVFLFSPATSCTTPEWLWDLTARLPGIPVWLTSWGWRVLLPCELHRAGCTTPGAFFPFEQRGCNHTCCSFPLVQTRPEKFALVYFCFLFHLVWHWSITRQEELVNNMTPARLLDSFGHRWAVF